MTIDKPDTSTLERLVAERLAAKEAAQAAIDAPHQVASRFPELIPDAPYAERSEEDINIDQLLDRVTILDAYNRWCGKMRPKVRSGQRESVMVSCPDPSHPDNTPSAWLNLDLDVWCCGRCNLEGGDKYDIAAWHFDGFSVPGYKNGENFHRLRQRMAEDLGYQVIRNKLDPSRPAHIVKIEPEKEPSNVVQLVKAVEREDDLDEELLFPELSTGSIFGVGTFGDLYQQANEDDDIPNEYTTFNAIHAMGLAVGKDVCLDDRPQVYANLFTCYIGDPGSRKSRSFNSLYRVLETLPYSQTDPLNNGVKFIEGAGSGQALVASYEKTCEILTSTKSKPEIVPLPVRGLTIFNELSEIIAITHMRGNNLSPTLINFYDCRNKVETLTVGRGEHTAWNPFFSLFTTTQPDSLNSLLNDDAYSGLLNRFLPILGTEKERIAVGGKEPDLSKAITRLKEIHEWGYNSGLGRVITFSEEALKLFTEHFHNDIVPDQRKSPLLTRIDLTEKKLMLNLAINEMTTVISEEIARTVISMYPYFVKMYGITASKIGNSKFNEIFHEYIRHIRRHTANKGIGPTESELNKYMRHKNYDEELKTRAWTALGKRSIIEEAEPEKGKPGRQARRYILAVNS